MQILFSGKYAIRGPVSSGRGPVYSGNDLDAPDDESGQKLDQIEAKIKQEAATQGIDVVIRNDTLYDTVPLEGIMERIVSSRPGLMVFTNEDAQHYRTWYDEAKQLCDRLFFPQKHPLTSAKIQSYPTEEEIKTADQKAGKDRHEWLRLMTETPLTFENALDDKGLFTFALVDGQPLKK